MSFTNATKLAAIALPYLDHLGNDVVVAIVKSTFEIDDGGRVIRADEPSPVRLADEPWDAESPQTSLRYPSDVCVVKVGADVVVLGEAVSKTPVKSLDVAVKVRDRTAPLRVHGERVFYRTMGRVAIGPAGSFERKPIIYERAYGGASDDYTVVETRNPAGVGVAKDHAELVDRAAPQIEHPARPHTSASDHHPPAGYGAIPAHWSPRRELVGTCDEAWEKTRMPLMPLDFDPRHNNVAHPALMFDEPIAPGDEVSILNMNPAGILRFQVPALGVVVRGIFTVSGKVAHRLAIDTLLVEPSRRRFEITGRAALPVGRGRDVLREVRIDTDDL